MENLLTKVQLLTVFKAWGVTEPIPKKNTVVHVSFPNKPLSSAKVSWTVLKGTYGDRLYRILFSRGDC